ncbi:MAG: hypothetical protein WKF40_00245 [Thermoleophilaceae bacterium]
MRRCLFLIALLTLAATPAAARADTASRPWPPATGQGTLMVHYGEEHLDDADGPTLLPKVVEESARYKPALVTTSGDKDNDGTVDQLQRWKQTLSPTTEPASPSSPPWETTTARPRRACPRARRGCSRPACRAT